METLPNQFERRAVGGSKSRLVELEAELSQSHDNLGRLASQLDRVNEDLERLTNYDSLTGLANRACFTIS